MYSRGQLLEAVWHTRLSAYEDNVNTHITRLRHRHLRRKLGTQFIQTVRGVGYRIPLP